MPSRATASTTDLTIPARLDAGAVVRRAITAWMGGHPRLDDALLAVTELVNNAVVHGGLEEGADLTVSMRAEGNGIRLTVRHAGPAFAVGELQPPSPKPGASRGLAIVEQIADRWGVEADGIEVSAWFEVGPRRADLNRG
jgi:anti-sigma regulatory factor (Ser/Thr protein kinase)